MHIQDAPVICEIRKRTMQPPRIIAIK